MLLKPSDRRNNQSLSDIFNSGWVKVGSSGEAVYVSGTSFSVSGDYSAYFTTSRKVRIYHNSSLIYKYAYISTSSYSGGITTVSVSGDTLLNETYGSVWLDLSPAGFTGTNATLTPGTAFVADGAGTPRFLPMGFSGMLNGKISVSVASNNLTVAIKGIDGNDPSNTNPVFVNIDGTIRSITSALSVTKNAGTNWFNSGAALQSANTNYFVYVIWNTTATPDSVTLGFSRIPYGSSYGDFSGTTTNNKYLAFSGSDTPASTDVTQNIGRFTASLTGASAYQWTLSDAKIKNIPTFESDKLSCIISETGFTVVSNSYQTYMINHSLATVSFNISNTSNGTGITFTLPFVAATTTYCFCKGTDNGSQLTTPSLVSIPSGSSTATVYPTLSTASLWTAANTKAFSGTISYLI